MANTLEAPIDPAVSTYGIISFPDDPDYYLSNGPDAVSDIPLDVIGVPVHLPNPEPTTQYRTAEIPEMPTDPIGPDQPDQIEPTPFLPWGPQNGNIYTKSVPAFNGPTIDWILN